MEYGIFNDEGLLEGGFYTEAAARRVMAAQYAEEDGYVGEICHDHPEQARDGCPECNE